MIKSFCLLRTLIFTIGAICRPNLNASMSANTELLLIDESILKGRVIPAISDFLDRGDSAAGKQLVQEAISSQQFRTAIKSSVNGDRAIAQYFAKGSTELLDGKLPEEIFDDTGHKIRNPVAIRKHKPKQSLAPSWFFFYVHGLETGFKLVSS